MTDTTSCLIAMAGLPGTGKSTLARALAARFGAPVLDKDAVRAALFGPTRTDYSREQDDLCMQAIYAEAARLVRSANPAQAMRPGIAPGGMSADMSRPLLAAILDGRTFSRHESVAALLDAAHRAGAALLVVECRCTDAVAEARLLADAALGRHPAANRGVHLYRSLRDAAQPLAAALAPVIASTCAELRASSGARVAHLLLDTGNLAGSGTTSPTAALMALVARVGESLAALTAESNR